MPKSSKTLLTLIKVLVSAGLVYWILRNSNLTEIWNSIRNANFALLIFAFCMFYAGYFITALRWKTLLHAQGVDAPLFYLVKSFMVAVFFNNFLPSTIGGDLMRMYDSYRMGGSKAGAVSVIFIDRLFGVTALLSYALIAILLSSAVRAQIPFLWLWVALAIGGAAIFAYVVFGSPAWLFDRVFALKEDRLGMPVRLLKKFMNAFQAFKGRKDILAKALGLSFLLQLNVIFHFIVLTWALHIDIPPLAMFIIIPIAAILMMVPISINAIGVREAVFVYFFSLFGVASEPAVAFAWIAFGFVILQGVVGGIVFALRKNRKAAGEGS